MVKNRSRRIKQANPFFCVAGKNNKPATSSSARGTSHPISVAKECSKGDCFNTETKPVKEKSLLVAVYTINNMHKATMDFKKNFRFILLEDLILRGE